MNIVITTGELERTDNNTLNYRKVGVNQTMLRCKLVPMDYGYIYMPRDIADILT
jgi:hypothetical protein